MDTAILVFAFTTGALAFFAPCCVGMLPAYVRYAVRAPQAQPASTRAASPVMVLVGAFPFALGLLPLLLTSLGAYGITPGWLYPYLPPVELSIGLVILGAALVLNAFVWTGRLATANRGLLFGLLATLGVLLGFLLVGAPVVLLAALLNPYLSYVSILVGLAILTLGILTLAGRSFAPRLPNLVPDVTRASGFVKFGIAYAAAGLTCTFPAFLAVMSAGLASGSLGGALGVFTAYALGKASVLIAVTAIIVAGGDAFAADLARHGRRIELASGVLLVAAGLFMIYFYTSTLLAAPA